MWIHTKNLALAVMTFRPYYYPSKQINNNLLIKNAKFKLYKQLDSRQSKFGCLQYCISMYNIQ